MGSLYTAPSSTYTPAASLPSVSSSLWDSEPTNGGGISGNSEELTNRLTALSSMSYESLFSDTADSASREGLPSEYDDDFLSDVLNSCMEQYE